MTTPSTIARLAADLADRLDTSGAAESAIADALDAYGITISDVYAWADGDLWAIDDLSDVRIGNVARALRDGITLASSTATKA